VDWTPGGDVDVVVTNAVLQWVPGHLDLLPRWLAALPPGGWLALQVPGNLEAPSHALVRELAAEPAWRGRIGLRDGTAVPGPAGYADVLAGAGADVDAWETTYLHRLTGPDPVLTWISGTALRPVRDALAPQEYGASVTSWRRVCAPPTRPGPDGTTWFPFRRVFAVARTR
jgi:trans-aconitate 2-methyltransferase